uniref:Protein twisted gastrulation-like n=2 Tax=Hirondellea gigas TaxID=1518452 RepID=A0A2P2I4N9_9CRUS
MTKPMVSAPPLWALLAASSLVLSMSVTTVEGSSQGRSCYDLVCASVVSKCLLTKACMCEITRDPSKCSCCHTCTQCLGVDYTRCCPCLGLCEELSPLSRESQVGDIKDPFNSLFEAMTAAPDGYKGWTHYTFPIDDTLHELGRRANVGDIKYEVVGSEGNTVASSPGGGLSINCTVMYVSECLSVTKCQDYCNQRGAASYRYFFDGCCECVGHTCLNYGINESRCSVCSRPDDDDFTNEIIGDNKP